MGEQSLNVLRSAELKRRGIAAVEDALRAGPVLSAHAQPAGHGRPFLPGVVAGSATSGGR
jgi:hypothetical protein